MSAAIIVARVCCIPWTRFPPAISARFKCVRTSAPETDSRLCVSDERRQENSGTTSVNNRRQTRMIAVEVARHWKINCRKHNNRSSEAHQTDREVRDFVLEAVNMGETFGRIPLEAEEDNHATDTSSPGKLRSVIPPQSFVKDRAGSGSQEVVMEEDLYLEGFGYVNAVLIRDCLTWQLADSDELVQTFCFGRQRDLESCRGQVLISDIYAAELCGVSSPGSSGMCGLFPDQLPQMYRFSVHTFDRSRSNKWSPKVHTFFHESTDICLSWVQRIQGLLDRDLSRPKNVLVLVNPYGGRKAGVRTWETVAPLFVRARVNTKVILTERAQHAYDLMAQLTEGDLNSLDGVIVVGGDGLFNEVLNGFVMHRHKGHPAPNPERVTELISKASKRQSHASSRIPSVESLRALANLERKIDPSCGPSFDVHSPLLQSSTTSVLQSRAASYYSASSSSNSSPSASVHKGPKSRMDQEGVVYAVPNKELELTAHDLFDSSVAGTTSEAEPLRIGEDFALPPIATEAVVGSGRRGDRGMLKSSDSNRLKSNAPLRIGIIPAGSTDTVVMSITGSRDPMTAALHILLGDNMPLDIVKITGWKESPQSADEIPRVRYAASFAGYGFYGDVMRESENARWLGPARYDAAGVKVFLKHKTYKAEVSFLDIPQSRAGSERLSSPYNSDLTTRNPRIICRVNCGTCAQGIDWNHLVHDHSEEEDGAPDELQSTKPRWKSVRGSFHSVGGAVMSCRNEKAPDGLAAHAHLADGLLHLILIRKCSRPSYLRQLISLTRRGADPFGFNFVEHYKTPVFTFTSVGEESIWNIDGELFPAHQLTAQVCRGLISVYARGPEH